MLVSKVATYSPRPGPFRPQEEAAHSLLPAWRAEELATRGDLVTCQALSSNESCGAAALIKLARHRSAQVRYNVLRSQAFDRLTHDAQAALLTRLAGDAHSQIAMAACSHPLTPAEGLERATNRWPERFPEVILAHPNCPTHLLIKFWETGEYDWQLKVLRHPSCPLELLRPHSHVQLREAVAANPRTPTAVLRELAHDPLARIVRFVASNEACPSDLQMELLTSARWPLGDCLFRCTSFPQITDAEVVAGLTEGDLVVAAWRQKIAPELLTGAPSWSNDAAREYVAADPRCSPELIARLARDHRLGVVATALANPQCPAATTQEVLALAQGCVRSQLELELVGRRSLVFTPELSEWLMTSSEARVRYLTIDHANFSKERLEAIAANDPAPGCQRTAKEQLRVARPTEPLPRPVHVAWREEITVLGAAAERVAWGLFCDGFAGPFSKLAAIAVGAVA